MASLCIRLNIGFFSLLARVFVTLFDAKHLLSPLLWNMFYREVELSECMQTLFRGSSLGSKIMAFCFKIYGATYLQGLLEPLIQDLIGKENSYSKISDAFLKSHRIPCFPNPSGGVT